MAQQLFKILHNANNHRHRHQQQQKKQSQLQQVSFLDVVKTHECDQTEYEAIEEERRAPNIIDDFLRMSFEPPKLGYSMGIHSAASVGAYTLVEQFIKEDINSVHRPNSLGWTPLMYAAQGGNLDICELLLNHGAQVHAPDAQGGKSATELARDWGHADCEGLLLSYGF